MGSAARATCPGDAPATRGRCWCQRAHAPADAGAARRPDGTMPSLQRFPTPARVRGPTTGDVVRAWAGLGLQPASGQPAPRRGRDGRATRRAACPTSTRCWRCPESAPTPRGPCWCSRSSATLRSVDTNAGVSSPARRRARRLDDEGGADAWPTHSCPAGRRGRGTRAVLRPRRARVHPPAPACERCPFAGSARGTAWDGLTGSGRRLGRHQPAQSTFAGSDRQGRGRLVDALRRGPVTRVRARRRDGLARRSRPDRTCRRAARGGRARDGSTASDSSWRSGHRSRCRRRPRRRRGPRISSSVRSWIGMGDEHARGCRHRAPATVRPRRRRRTRSRRRTRRECRAASRSAMSCTLHDVHEPQSASASITTSHFVAIS